MKGINYYDVLSKFYKPFSIDFRKPLIYVFCPLRNTDLASKHWPVQNEVFLFCMQCAWQLIKSLTIFEVNFIILIIFSWHMLLSNSTVRKTGFICILSKVLWRDSPFTLRACSLCKAVLDILWYVGSLAKHAPALKSSPGNQKIKGNGATLHLSWIRDNLSSLPHASLSPG